ncbi:PIN domain-like protein [Tricholoma matsutake]|nr:PIN domain-like protein [Tricholoma matsutake 945]
MGVNGLWQSLQEKTSLCISLQLNMVFCRIKGVGWFYQASSRCGHTKNHELAELFGRCARLLSLPFFPIFVFDGPEQPAQKHNKIVHGTQHWLARDMQEMLDCFGIPWVNIGTWGGRGGASLDVERGLIDAILTDDSNIFVFGDSKDQWVMMYDQESIHELGFCQEDFVLIALLVGGNYSPGLKGCGQTTASVLACAGFGQRLVVGTGDNHSPEHVAAFLAAWCEDLIIELCENRSGFLKQHQPKLANLIPNTFPDLQILRLYTHPKTLQHQAAFVMPPLVSNGGIDTVALSHFAKRTFVWGQDPGSVLQHFASFVFSGIAVQELIRHASSAYQREARVKLHFEREYLASICWAASDMGDGTAVDKIVGIRAWLPAAMLEHSIPQSGGVKTVDNGSSNDELGDVSECKMDTDDDGRESVEAMLISPSLEPKHNHDVIEVMSSPEPECGDIFLSLIFVALLTCVLAHSSLCDRETLHYTS